MSRPWVDLTWDQVCRSASGRRHYNSWRKFLAADRQIKVSQLVRKYGGLRWGVQSAIARELGVHRSIICRDFAVLFFPSAGPRKRTGPGLADLVCQPPTPI